MVALPPAGSGVERDEEGRRALTIVRSWKSIEKAPTLTMDVPVIAVDNSVKPLAISCPGKC